MRMFLIAAASAMLAAQSGYAGLVNHYTFDSADTSGVTASDTAGSFANDATWADGTAAQLSNDVPGIIGEAVQLLGASGSSNQYNVASGPGASMEIAGTSNLTISGWIQPDLTQTDTFQGIIVSRNTVVTRTGVGNFPNQYWGLAWAQNGDGDWYVRADATGSVSSSVVYDTSEQQAPEWVHVAMVYSGDQVQNSSDVLQIYVNGVLDNSASINSDVHVSGDWRIGRDNTNTRTFGGLLDDFAVFDMSLTEAEIALIYASGLQGIDAATALAVPEPSTVMLTMLAASGMGVVCMRRRLG